MTLSNVGGSSAFGALSQMSAYGLLGLLGVALYLIAYALMQLGYMRGASMWHTILNLMAAICVLISLQENFNLSSAMIQICWIAISVIGLLRLYYIHQMTTFDPVELNFVKTKLSGLSKDQAKKFLKLGEWHTGHTGQVLAREGERNTHLHYIAEGIAAVSKKGVDIAACESGDFVGEITYLNGEPATGTVTLTGPATLFSIEVEKVRKHLKRDHALYSEFEKSIADDLRHKLVRPAAAVRSTASPAE